MCNPGAGSAFKARLSAHFSYNVFDLRLKTIHPELHNDPGHIGLEEKHR